MIDTQPKSSFGWPLASSRYQGDTKLDDGAAFCSLQAGRHHLSLYFGYTNVYYIYKYIHIPIHIVSYIAFEIHITQVDAISVFTLALLMLPPLWQLNPFFDCPNAMHRHYVYGDRDYMK